MVVENTTSVPSNEDVQKGISFDNTEGAAKDIWVPANGANAQLMDVVISVMNKANSSFIIVGVQVFVGGSWRTLVPVAVGSQGGANFAHNFGGRIRSAVGNGTAARVRAAKTGNSTNWEAQIIVTGKEVPK